MAQAGAGHVEQEVSGELTLGRGRRVRQILYLAWSSEETNECSSEKIPQAHLPSSSDKNHHISSVWPRVICRAALSLSLSSISSTKSYIVISCNLLSSPDGDVHIKVRRDEDDPDAQPRVHVDLVRFRARFSSPSHGWVMSGRVDLEIKEGGGDANEQRHHLAGGITR